MEKRSAAEIKKIKEACLSNAESCLAMAERELGKGADHLCFHLALLALEEVGKSVLVSMGYTISAAENEDLRPAEAVDNHTRKIFWALWSGFINNEKYTPEEIEHMRGLATHLHESRLAYLYVDPNDSLTPSAKIKSGEAKNLIDLTRARLEYEKKINADVHEFTPEEIEKLKWFFTAQADLNLRDYIFNGTSVKKLHEFQNGRDWIEWLYEGFKKNREEMLTLVQKEISRKQPLEHEKFDPKYKMRFRIQSASHTIRDNAFSDWNDKVDRTKVYKTSKKNLPVWAKSELIIEIVFPKIISPGFLWDHAFSEAKTFVNAINIATVGLFWWNLPKDVEKYYEEMADLEADPQGRTFLVVAPEKRLMIDWGSDHGRTLKKEDIGEISRTLMFLMIHHGKLDEFMRPYALGLTLFSKTDIHLRLEVNAVHEFFKALKSAMLYFGDWDSTADFSETVTKIFSPILPSTEHVDELLQKAISIDSNPVIPIELTLTDVLAMKMYCDFYIKLRIKKRFEGFDETKDDFWTYDASNKN